MGRGEGEEGAGSARTGEHSGTHPRVALGLPQERVAQHHGEGQRRAKGPRLVLPWQRGGRALPKALQHLLSAIQDYLRDPARRKLKRCRSEEGCGGAWCVWAPC